MKKRQIAVDLDGTLAHYDKWKGIAHIGDPVPAMLARVKGWLRDGHEVVIFSARVSASHPDAEEAKEHIRIWCLLHLKTLLPVTADKMPHLEEFWDDRAIGVEKNTGRPLHDVEHLEPTPSSQVEFAGLERPRRRR